MTVVFPEVTIEAADGDAWQATLAARWNVGRNQNGGVLLATASSVLCRAARQSHPLTVTGHYLRATEAGECSIRTSLIREGRTSTTATAELRQGGKERLRVLGTFGDLAQRLHGGPSIVQPLAPPIPAPEHCEDLFDILTRTEAGEKALTRSLRNFAVRVDPDRGWGRGPDGQPRLSGWLRMNDEEAITPVMLLAIADAFPPTVMSSAVIGWLPTLELTVHVLGIPAADEPWLRAELTTRAVSGGLVDEDASCGTRPGAWWPASASSP